MTNENLAMAEAAVFGITNDLPLLRTAIGRMDEVVEVYEAMQETFYIEKARLDRDAMRSELARRAG